LFVVQKDYSKKKKKKKELAGEKDEALTEKRRKRGGVLPQPLGGKTVKKKGKGKDPILLLHIRQGRKSATAKKVLIQGKKDGEREESPHPPGKKCRHPVGKTRPTRCCGKF